jgi:predicted nucleic acid-binding protein
LSTVVVDASVAAKWFLEEPHTDLARHLLGSGKALHAPEHLLLEVDNILCKRMRWRQMSPERADIVRRSLRAMPLERHPLDELLDSAFVIARDARCSVYDGLYLALALSLNARMVTDDLRLLRNMAGGPLSQHILWIGDVP